MKVFKILLGLYLIFITFSTTTLAATEVQWWHAM